MVKKTGKPVNLSKPFSGFSIRYNAGRIQPYTIWCGNESIAFADTVEAAERLLEAEINENRSKTRLSK